MLCDTNGGTLPHEVEAIVREVVKVVPGDHVGIHAHNDTEQAVANSFAAVRAGARQIQGTLNGLGERCGNANLVSIIPTLKLKPEFAEVTMKPATEVEMAGEDAARMQKLLDALEGLDDGLAELVRIRSEVGAALVLESELLAKFAEGNSLRHYSGRATAPPDVGTAPHNEFALLCPAADDKKQLSRRLQEALQPGRGGGPEPPAKPRAR